MPLGGIIWFPLNHVIIQLSLPLFDLYFCCRSVYKEDLISLEHTEWVQISPTLNKNECLMSTSVKVHNTRAIHALREMKVKCLRTTLGISNFIDYRDVADILFNANNTLSNWKYFEWTLIYQLRSAADLSVHLVEQILFDSMYIRKKVVSLSSFLTTITYDIISISIKQGLIVHATVNGLIL